MITAKPIELTSQLNRSRSDLLHIIDNCSELVIDSLILKIILYYYKYKGNSASRYRCSIAGGACLWEMIPGSDVNERTLVGMETVATYFFWALKSGVTHWN